MDFLLRLKHWQLFLLMTVPSYFTTFLDSAGIWNFVFFVFYIGWIYTIGMKMNSFLPSDIRPGTKLFKVHCLLLVGITLFAYNLSAYSQFSPFDSIYNAVFFTCFLLILIYLQLSIWMFAARMLESMIEGEIVNRSDSLKAFFCLWMFPIGVWYIQPAVQRVLAKYETPDAFTDLPA
ncbi:hypothetical protein [Mucilaginibacter flavidus]|uniref:hypothetical protein n=1 Tax=Mucilaginibacter flavidus TaxID=2949309 RepID=UPI00209335FB|nr:hypothetical protein [Mucilaginibacter flavidus]MCO5945719.1 hypothetical protein [Mucilaginibacter flavidus]